MFDNTTNFKFIFSFSFQVTFFRFLLNHFGTYEITLKITIQLSRYKEDVFLKCFHHRWRGEILRLGNQISQEISLESYFSDLINFSLFFYL